MKDSIVIDMKYADYDMIDGSYGVERHHLMGGANRNHADEDGLWVPLSPDHHNSSRMSVHHNKEMKVIPDWIGVYIGDYCAKKAKKQDLSGREYKMRRSVNGRSTEVSTLWVDMLKESMIRSLYRDSDKLIQTEDEQYISRLRSQIDKARTERDRESKKYLRLWKTVRKEFGDEKAWELIEKAEE